MNFIKHNRKKLQLGFFVLFTLLMLVVVIVHFVNLSDFSELRQAIKDLEEQQGIYGDAMEPALSAARKAYTEALIPWIIDVILYILALGTAALGTFKTYKECEKKTSFAFLNSGLLFLGLGYGIGNAYNVSEISKSFKDLPPEYRPDMPGELIALIVLGFLCVAFAIIGILISDYYMKAKRGATALAGLTLFICPCITLDKILKGSESSYKVIEAFVLIIGLLSIAASLIIDELYTYHARSKVVHHSTYSSSGSNYASTGTNVNRTTSSNTATTILTKPEPAQRPVQQTANADPIAQLRKLKELLNEGIITEDEYNEKRKKYVEKL